MFVRSSLTHVLFSSFSRATDNRIMDPMPSLLLLTAPTPRQHLPPEVTPSSNNSMGPLMASQHQVSH